MLSTAFRNYGEIYSPPRRGGVDATSIKYREATFAGADGVVSSAGTFSQADHPVCAASVASLHFLSGAATPPLRGGECRFFSIRFTAITKVRTIKTPPPADSRMPPSGNTCRDLCGPRSIEIRTRAGY